MTEYAEADPGLPKEVRNWGMACHIIALVGLFGNGIGFLVGPLIVWLVKREDHPFIDEQGKEAVNFQITMMLAVIVSIILSFVLIGIFFLLVLIVLEIVLPIVAAIRANNGEYYRYPFAIRLIK